MKSNCHDHPPAQLESFDLPLTSSDDTRRRVEIRLQAQALLLQNQLYCNFKEWTASKLFPDSATQQENDDKA